MRDLLPSGKGFSRRIIALNWVMSVPAVSIVLACLYLLLELSWTQWTWLLGATVAYSVLVGPLQARWQQGFLAPVGRYLDARRAGGATREQRRQAFERVEISRTRVNFDDELQATRNLDLLGPLRGARRVLRYGYAIFEIKVDNVLPYWLHTLIAKYNLQNEALSKYCYAVQSEVQVSAIGREMMM